MKSKIFATLLLGLSLSATAQTVENRVVRSQLKKVQGAPVVESKLLDNGMQLNVRETTDGLRFKQLVMPNNNKEVVRPNTTGRKLTSHKTPAIPRFRESFEGWDGQSNKWLPDGWSRHTNDTVPNKTWFINSQTSVYVPGPVDGDYYMEIIYDKNNSQNEWLDSPELTVEEGDYFNANFIAQPFTLFDITLYDSKTKSFSDIVNMWNFRIYMQVDGGSWEEIYNFYNEFKDLQSPNTAYDLWYEQSYYGPRTIKVTKNMQDYVGHKVKFRFRYTGQDGDSMWLDLIELGKPYLTASYYEPSHTTNFGMTQDYKMPVNWAYYPDGDTLTWTNTSCSDATGYQWQYTDPETRNTLTSTEKNLTASFVHIPEKVGSITNANVYDSPILTVTRDGYPSDTFGGATSKFKIGGKTYVNVDGKESHCGAGTYYEDQGMTVLTTEDGYPITGYQEGKTSQYWYDVNGVSSDDYVISVIGIYNSFSTPHKPYKIRGLWVHGIGQIEQNNNITATIHTLDEDGAIVEKPIATAYLDYDSIQTYASAKEDIGMDYPYITLPFLFADPVEINQFILVRINGISDDGVTYFAPIQSRIPDSGGSCHGYLRMRAESRTTGNDTNVGLTALSEISTDDYGPCYSSFYITLDMAYGDCDDWGHLDNVRGGNSMLRLENGRIQQYIPTSTTGLYDRPVRSAFYNNTSSFKNILYLCAGALEAGDSPELTNHIRIEMPRLSFGKDIDIETNPVVTVGFWNCMTSTYYYATEGTLHVDKTDTGYNVKCDVYDESDDMYFGSIYQDMPWICDTITKVIENQLRIYYIADSIHSETDNLEEYKINSAYVNDANEDQYIIYLATQEGIDTEAKMLALEGEPAMIIKAPKSYLADYYWGYSALYNEHFDDCKNISITFRGVEYTPENVFGASQVEGGVPLAKGATIHGSFADNYLTGFEFFLSAPTALDGRCVKGYYDGPASTSGHSTSIKTINIASQKAVRYNLNGQRVNNQYRGIILQNGKKFMNK